MKTTQKTDNSLLKLLTLIIFSLLMLNSEKSLAQHPDGWLYTENNKIYKSDGTVFAGRGANVFDTRSCWAGNYSEPNVDEVKRRIDELVDVWGADFMRLCLQSEASLGEWMVHGLSVLQDPDYVDDIVEIVEHIGTKTDVYVLVSVWVDPSLDDMGWPTDATADVWKILVQNLASYPHVLFGICNEPQSNSNGTLDAQVWERMNNMVDTIRKEEAKLGSNEHIITVQGTRDWARSIEYYVAHPITAGGGTNIAYETHVYDHEDKFEEYFINPSQHIPVVIGEFGPAVMNGNLYMTIDECELLMDAAEALQIPYTGWSFHQRCSPDLLVDPTGSGSGAGMDLLPTEWGETLMYQLLGIEVPKIKDFAVNPSNISNQTDTEITISATITNDGGAIESVTLNLSELGGGSSVSMSNSGDSYSATYTVIAGLSTGKKTITINALNEQGYNKIKTVELNVYSPATDDMIIYNDNQTLITSTWVGGSTGTLSESTSDAYEGSKHYQFAYNFSGWYANFGLNFGTGHDFTGYQAIQFACKITGTESAFITLRDAGGTYSEAIDIKDISGNYQVFTIPLSSFTEIPLNAVSEIKIDLGGAQSGSGTLFLDNIILIADMSTVNTNIIRSDNSNSPIIFYNWPNPFSNFTTISFNVPEAGHYNLTVYDLNGRKVIELFNKSIPAGNHQVEWNGTDSNEKELKSGIYFYKLEGSNGFTGTKKMILTNK